MVPTFIGSYFLLSSCYILFSEHTKSYIMRYLKLVTCIIIGCNLVGCNSALKKNTQANASKVPYNSVVEQELVAAAKTIENSLALLARTQEENNVPLLNTAPLITPEGGMGGTADVDWTGPIEPLVRKLADMTDYKVKVLGSAPGIPIIVSISQNNAVIADILKNS